MTEAPTRKRYQHGAHHNASLRFRDVDVPPEPVFRDFVSVLSWLKLHRIAHAIALRSHGKSILDRGVPRIVPPHKYTEPSGTDRDLSPAWRAFWRARSDAFLRLCRWNGWGVEDGIDASRSIRAVH